MSKPISVDVLIIGAGAAGLWCARRLIAEGFSVAVIESGGVGGGQTAASQGILHAGVKYALTGRAGESSRSAARGAAMWAEAMGGSGPVDLSGLQTLSSEMFLWSSGDPASGMVLGAAVMAIRSGVKKLAGDQRPAWLREIDGPVYTVAERVICVSSAARELSRGVPIVGIRSVGAITKIDGVTVVQVECDEGARVEFAAGRVLACAGVGNESILQVIGVGAKGVAQRRPLAMVLARGVPEPVFGHCVSTSTVPRLTITSGETADGGHCWWIGGQVAERGATMSDTEVRDVASGELAHCMGSLDTSRASLEVVRVDRAEGFDERGKRPDNIIVRDVNGVMFCWPTKLVLAPILAEEVAARVRASGAPIVPQSEVAERCAGLSSPAFARTPWGGAP